MVKNKIEKKFWKIIVDTHSIREGHFYYKANFHTQYYIDTFLIFQYSNYVEMVVKELYSYFSDKDIDYIITPNYRSGAILAHNMGEKFNAKVETIRREHGIVNIPPDLNINGNVLIIDDGINTGNSLKQLLNISRNARISIEGIGIFIDRYIGNLEKDFNGLVRSIVTLRGTPYEIVNIDEKPCKLCKEYIRVKKALSGAKDLNSKKDLLRKMKKLELRCVYGDID